MENFLPDNLLSTSNVSYNSDTYGLFPSCQQFPEGFKVTAQLVLATVPSLAWCQMIQSKAVKTLLEND